MSSFWRKIIPCGRKNRARSAHPITTEQVVLSPHTCENCSQKFANKSLFATHKQTCTVENPSLNQSKDGFSNKVSQFNKGANTKGRNGKPQDDKTADSIHQNDVTDKSNPQRKTVYDINKSLSPDKSLSDTTDMKYDTMSDKFSTISQNPYEIQATQFMEELSKKNPREKREAELNFVTKNIEKTTQVKFLVSEQWIENYTSYLNGESKTPPTAIDNTQLKHMVLTKTLPKNLYIINEHIWRFIHKMYSGGPEIKQNNKAISFYGGSVSDHLSETQTADTFSRSEGLESMRNSVIETQMTPWYINTTPYLKPIGFANNSFFCYMNSCLQMLLGITELSQYIYQEKYKGTSSSKEDQKFWRSMTEIVHGHFRQQTCLTPKLLRRLSYKMFDPNQQHDVHEFMSFLFSGMQDELNLPLPKKEMEFKTPESAWIHYKKYHVSLVDNLLAGQLTSTVRCTNCKHVSTTFDPFLDLSLPIIPGQTKELDDCLTAFQNEEDIDDNYRCEKCKVTGKAKKKLHVHRWPKYLVVNFKRFQTHPKKIKIKEMINFPMSNWKLKDDSTKEVHSYSLLGVTVHYGPIDSGHYVCYTKRGDNWIFCDDESLTKVQESEVSTKEAYVLIYERGNPLGSARR